MNDHLARRGFVNWVWLALMALVLVWGCGADDAPAEEAPASEAEEAPSDEPSAECASSLAPLTDYLVHMSENASDFIDIADTPVATFGEPLRPMPIVRFDDGSLTLDGRRIGPVTEDTTWSSLGQEMATLRRNWSVLHPNSEFPSTVLVAAAASTPVAQVSRLAGVDGIETLDIVVQNGNAEERPSVETPDWVREATESGERSAIDAAYERATGGCEEAEPWSVLVHRLDPTQPARRLGEFDGRTLPGVLTECGCEGVDVTGLIALIDASGRAGRQQRRVTVQLREDGFDLALADGADLGAFIAALQEVDPGNRGAVHLATAN